MYFSKYLKKYWPDCYKIWNVISIIILLISHEILCKSHKRCGNYDVFNVILPISKVTKLNFVLFSKQNIAMPKNISYMCVKHHIKIAHFIISALLCMSIKKNSLIACVTSVCLDNGPTKATHRKNRWLTRFHSSTTHRSSCLTLRYIDTHWIVIHIWIIMLWWKYVSNLLIKIFIKFQL